MSTPAANLGFERPRRTRQRRQCWLGAGKTKTGKTRFGLTFPGPIAVLSFDRAIEDVLHEVPGADVVVKDFTRSFKLGEPMTQAQAQAVEAEFAKAYLGALEHKDIRTVMIDKGTTLWEIMRYAEWGKIDHVKAHHYVGVNSRMRRYLLAFQDSTKNVYIVDDVKEEWDDNGKPTGQFKREGFKHTPGLVQVCASFERVEKGKDFFMTLEECALNSSLIGWKFEGPEIDFRQIAGMVMTDSVAEDWK